MTQSSTKDATEKIYTAGSRFKRLRKKYNNSEDEGASDGDELSEEDGEDQVDQRTTVEVDEDQLEDDEEISFVPYRWKYRPEPDQEAAKSEAYPSHEAAKARLAASERIRTLHKAYTGALEKGEELEIIEFIDVEIDV